MNDAARDASDAARSALADGAILFDRRRLAQADLDAFERARRDASARATQPGGRGGVRALQGSFGEAVLRHYRRGGLVARVVADRYLWRGEEATRSFREFRLLAALRARGLAVPEPLAAAYSRQGAFYRADLLTRRVPHAETLARLATQDGEGAPPWRRLGETLAAFHAAGAFHADLNAHNILVDRDGRVWLLDFDRGALRRPDPSWMRANLARLRRSLHKIGASARPGWEHAWRELLAGYHGIAGEAVA